MSPTEYQRIRLEANDKKHENQMSPYRLARAGRCNGEDGEVNVATRGNATTEDGTNACTLMDPYPYYVDYVDGRPYLPNLTVNLSEESKSNNDNDNDNDNASSNGDNITTGAPSESMHRSMETSVARAACAVVYFNAFRSSSTSTPMSPTPMLSSPTKGTAEENEGETWQGGEEGKLFAWFLSGTESRKDLPLEVTTVCGGITNSLFRVSGLRSLLVPNRGAEDGEEEPKTTESETETDEMVPDSVLVRVFGAEGMIDRDVETSTYASLCDSNIAGRYLGRFSNGRIEGWFDGYRTLAVSDLSNPDMVISKAIARQMAFLHGTYRVPTHLRPYHDATQPAMWTQLHSWMDRARKHDSFRTPDDDARASDLDLPMISSQLEWLERDVVPHNATVAFCHNDLLAANVMVCPITGNVQLIDFEYGGMNYVGFDIANHFNEHAGGTTVEDNGVPDYTKFPDEGRRRAFVREYVMTVKRGGDGAVGGVDDEDIEDEVQTLLNEVDAFVLANHLYWGLWAVNQAATEGCDDFDYLTYAKNRFEQYYRVKEKLENNEGVVNTELRN